MVVRTASRNDLSRREDFQQNSTKSIALPTDPPKQNEEEQLMPAWIMNPKATSFVTKLLTSMYFLLLSLAALLISLSSPWSTMWLAETIFSLLMYLIAILFFIYTYIFVIYQKPFNTLILFLHRKTKLIQRPDRFLIKDPNHTGEGAGTMYLRLGALFFGTLGSIIWGCEIYLRFSESVYHSLTSAKYMAALLFTFLQMHFLFCNSKIVFNKTDRFASFGLMHCIAVNLWTWFSLCLVKAEVKKMKKYKKMAVASSSSSSSMEEEEEKITEIVVQLVTNTTDPFVRLQSMTKLGSFSSFLLTCLVEYSIIGGAVCFIIWKSIGEVHESTESSKKKKRFRFECRNTTLGLFLGILCTIGACIAIGIGSMFYNQGQNSRGDLVIGIVNLILFIVALLACFLGVWRTRTLEYRLHPHGEVIDEILLIIALIGEFLYSAIGFDLTLVSKEQKMATSKLAVAVFSMRIIQVIVQFAFILIASRLRCLSPKNIAEQHGKQTLTFMMIINVTLFVYHNFEATHSYYGFPKDMENTYSTLLNACSPLTVFYRFHSSACIAEIWKHTYSTKHATHHQHSA